MTWRLLALALCLAGCKPPPDRILAHPTALATEAIHVVSHGWHTGIVVPAIDIQQHLPALRERFGAVPFIEFGWGDAGFYQASEITLGLALESLLWPTESVMHVVAVRRAPARVFAHSEIRRLCLSDTGYAALIDFIVNSFARGPNGDVVALRPGVYGDSQFYRGAGGYHAFNTCNTWTARGLQRAGVDIAARFTLTASGVMRAITVDRSCGQATPR